MYLKPIEWHKQSSSLLLFLLCSSFLIIFHHFSFFSPAHRQIYYLISLASSSTSIFYISLISSLVEQLPTMLLLLHWFATLSQSHLLNPLFSLCSFVISYQAITVFTNLPDQWCIAIFEPSDIYVCEFVVRIYRRTLFPYLQTPLYLDPHFGPITIRQSAGSPWYSIIKHFPFFPIS